MSSIRILQSENEQLRNRLKEFEKHEGRRDGRVRCGQAALDALGLDDEHNSPNEVKEAIEQLQTLLSTLAKGISEGVTSSLLGCLVPTYLKALWSTFPQKESHEEKSS